MAIAAVDSSLWDLKARLLDMPLVTLLGAVRDGAPVYGSSAVSRRIHASNCNGNWATGLPKVFPASR